MQSKAVATVLCFIWPSLWPQDKTEPSSASHSTTLLHLSPAFSQTRWLSFTAPDSLRNKTGGAVWRSKFSRWSQPYPFVSPLVWRLNLTNSLFEDANLSFNMKSLSEIGPGFQMWKSQFYKWRFLVLHFEPLKVTPWGYFRGLKSKRSRCFSILGLVNQCVIISHWLPKGPQRARTSSPPLRNRKSTHTQWFFCRSPPLPLISTRLGLMFLRPTSAGFLQSHLGPQSQGLHGSTEFIAPEKSTSWL